MTKNETYQITTLCNNCGHVPKETASDGTVIAPLVYNIPKGKDVDRFLISVGCPNCGCIGYLRRLL